MNYWARYVLYRHRHALARLRRAGLACGLGAALLFLIYNVSLSGIISKIPSGRLNFSLFDIAVSWSERDPVGLIRTGAPVMAWAGNQEDFPEEITPGSLATAVLAPFRVSLASPLDLLASEMPALAEYRTGLAVPTASNQGSGNVRATSAPAAGHKLSPGIMVGIYYTHTGESYLLPGGVERVTGGRGGVVETGRVMKEILEKDYGIRVVLDDRVNDEIYSQSYIESEKTARRLLEEYKDIGILFDIHRDAGKEREESLVLIDGKEVATILFVVGSDARAPFPTWRNNYNFALKLAGRINDAYPGLCAGVRVKEGRYNQFLHPKALLVEIGSVANSTEEAVRAASLLARVLAGEVYDISAANPGGTEDAKQPRPAAEAAPKVP